jgi:aquaporin Z
MVRMNRYVCELLGTFCLVFAGTGAIAVNEISGAIGHVGIALTFGLIVMCMIYSVGDVSGAHLNPAVTFGFWCLRLFPGKEVFPYIVSQVAGAVLASLMVKYFVPASETLGMTLPAESMSLFSTCLLEAILTFMLMFVIIHVSEGAKEVGLMAGVAIGGVVALEAMFAGPLTGASMNPARSIGPAVCAGDVHSLWIYLVGPCVGAALACVTCRLIRGEACCQGTGGC